MTEVERKPQVTHAEVENQELARIAVHEDHQNDGMFAGIRRFPWAFIWCIYASWQILLVSFENSASGQITGVVQFRKDFGTEYELGKYVLNAVWQSSFGGGPIAAQVVGALVTGQLADWIGRKKTVMAALLLSFITITVEVIATQNEVFFVGKFFNGFAVGTLKTISATYIGEAAPVALRGLLTATIGLGYCIGPLIVASILKGTATWDNRWAYRTVFASQYGVAVVSAIFVWFMPESPWWLTSKGRDADALRSLCRLGYRDGNERLRLAEIKVTLEQVRAETEGVSYVECFRKSNLRRTIISISPLSIQAFAGILFINSYLTYYIQLAGFSPSLSFTIGVVQQCVSLIGNVASWFLIERVGRRRLLIIGCSLLMICMLLTGVLTVVQTRSALIGTIAMLLLYGFFYNLTIGAAAFSVLAEVSTARLRAKTVAIGLAVQNSIYVMWSYIIPFIINPDKGNWGGKIGFLFAGCTIFSIVYLYFYQPETRGRSYMELDEMFMKKVPARKFRHYVVSDGQEDIADKTN